MYRPDRPHVLVVDDEPSICAALQMGLVREGYEVSVALTGEDAENFFRTTHFDLLILDLRLKQTRGDVLFYHATACQPHLKRRTIFLTGDITDAGWRHINATECPGLLKPFNLQELFALLSSLMPRRAEESA